VHRQLNITLHPVWLSLLYLYYAEGRNGGCLKHLVLRLTHFVCAQARVMLFVPT